MQKTSQLDFIYDHSMSTLSDLVHSSHNLLPFVDLNEIVERNIIGWIVESGKINFKHQSCTKKVPMLNHLW